MYLPRQLLLVLLLVGRSAAAQADASAVQAVYLDVCIAEQDVNRVTEKVHDPIVEALKALPGMRNIDSVATHGKAQFQIRFKDGASRNDKAGVEEVLKRVVFPADVEVLSTLVELAQPRDDGLFVGRLACTEHLRRAARQAPRR